MASQHYFAAAYILIRAPQDKRKGAATDRGVNKGCNIQVIQEQLLKIDGVRIAHALVGPADLICYIEGFDPSSFNATLKDVRHSVLTKFDGYIETFMIHTEKGKGYSAAEQKPAPAAAWLLCTVSVSNPEVIVDDLLAIKGVVNAHTVLGRFDIIAYIEAKTMHELQGIIDKGIRQAKALSTTDTRIVLNRH